MKKSLALLIGLSSISAIAGTYPDVGSYVEYDLYSGGEPVGTYRKEVIAVANKELYVSITKTSSISGTYAEISPVSIKDLKSQEEMNRLVINCEDETFQEGLSLNTISINSSVQVGDDDIFETCIAVFENTSSQKVVVNEYSAIVPFNKVNFDIRKTMDQEPVKAYELKDYKYNPIVIEDSSN